MFFNHDLFYSGIFLGEGEISFGSSSDRLKFYTKWMIIQESESVTAEQTIEIQTIKEQNINFFTFKNFQKQRFTITLKNQAIGQIEGEGSWDENFIKWQFYESEKLEGFEVYEKGSKEGEYRFWAQYGSSPPYHTIIEGRLWKKS